MFHFFKPKSLAEEASEDHPKKIVNVPEQELDFKPITAEEIKADEKRSLDLITAEFKRAFEFIPKFPKSVSFFGSARFPEDDEHCKQARELSEKIVRELGYAIVTGGGPGIMQAANRGAKEADGESLGLSIRLPHEQLTNPYVKRSVSFYYFFTRKTALSFAAEAYIFFPGGFGTLDEFFEMITLVQTKKIPKVPVILVGRDFWEPLHDFIQANMYKLHRAINEDDMNLYHITDNYDEIVDIIRRAPVKNWWKGFEVI